MSNDYELRYSVDALTPADNGKLVGYAVRWNDWSADLGGFVETIRPGAFARSLASNADVRALVEHDPKKILARASNGSLVVGEDEHGLRVSITPADTSYARDIIALVRAGTVTGMSFKFRPYPGGATLDTSTRPAKRTITAAELTEVSIVSVPAYPTTNVEVRSIIEQHNRTAMAHLRLASL